MNLTENAALTEKAGFEFQSEKMGTGYVTDYVMADDSPEQIEETRKKLVEKLKTKHKVSKLGKVERVGFNKIDEVLEMPDFIEIQKNSYQWLIKYGLREILNDVSEIVDSNKKYRLDFVDYRIDPQPKHSITESKDRDVTYASPLRVTARLTFLETGEIVENDIYMCDFPLMTENGTFIINGAERAIVSQLIRSPGVYYNFERDKNGKKLFNATVIPNRGAWLEFEIDGNDVAYIKIDKNRRIPVTTYIRAMSAIGQNGKIADNAAEDGEDFIKELFGEDEIIKETLSHAQIVKQKLRPNSSGGTSGNEALLEVYNNLKNTEVPSVENAVNYLHQLFFDGKRYNLARFGRYKYNKKLGIGLRLSGQILAFPIADPITGEILLDVSDGPVSLEKALEIEQAGVLWADVKTTVCPDPDDKSTKIPPHGEDRIVRIRGNGMVDIRPYIPEAITDEELENWGITEKVDFYILKRIFDEFGKYSPEDYTEDDIISLKEALAKNASKLCSLHITHNDIYASLSYFINLSQNIGVIDDIDHLGNRRIRSVGELLQANIRIGFLRAERIIKEKMGLIGGNRPSRAAIADIADELEDVEESADENKPNSGISPQSLINIRPVIASIKEFFGSSPLSQFMDQNNPLAELTHKRRLSALGPGGLSRERAGFEVRDVHYSHYGRMCPIETPEGPNIGLINYLATFARINRYGFIEAPYCKVDKETGKVLNETVYMTADLEDHFTVAQANEPLDEEGRFKNPRVTARHRDETISVARELVDFMDVSPKMVVSVATAMIPFLENDDANRALMGANMQRQAVPLMITESPDIGTGMEHKVAVDSGVMVLAHIDGTVTKVDALNVEVTGDSGESVNHPLIKFKRSNQGTCINQRVAVSKGDKVKKGDLLADGPATSDGEIALGKNVLIGFMTWEGYNYEDAVLLSEKLVYNDVFTSIHIEEHEIECRVTKLGKEEITRDIPNVGDDMLKNLDDRGIIRVGAEVNSNDILVGKVTPKGESELVAEEKLLRALFGNKVRETRDSSLKVPHGESGIVVNVQIFTKENCEELPPGVETKVKVFVAQKRKISVGDKMAGRHGNKGVVSRILPVEDMPFLPDGTPLDIVLNPLGVPSRMNIGQVLEVHLGLAAHTLGLKIMTPVFDGAKENDIHEFLDEARVLKPYIQEDAKIQLTDGRTGEKFDNPVTVGYLYYLKLHHLVDDKIHARSTGPYSLVTQQPLGGKAQFGGQRFGEMEVWALEAYGAAHTLQEILTVKSDDVTGRAASYSAIVNDKEIPESGVPESFRVLVKELQSLGLDVSVLDEDGGIIDLNRKFEEDVLNETETTSIMPEEIIANESELEKRGNILIDEPSDIFSSDSLAEEIDGEEELEEIEDDVDLSIVAEGDDYDMPNDEFNEDDDLGDLDKLDDDSKSLIGSVFGKKSTDNPFDE